MIPQINHRSPPSLPAAAPIVGPCTARSLSPAGATSTMPKRSQDFHINLLRRHVHPANVIAVAVANQLGREIVHPVGIRLPKPGPFVARSLGKSFEIDKLVVEMNTPPVPAPPLNSVLRKPVVVLQTSTTLPSTVSNGVNIVQIRIVDAPKSCILQRAGRFDHRFFAADHVERIGGKFGNSDAIADRQSPPKDRPTGPIGRSIVNLRFDRDSRSSIRAPKYQRDRRRCPWFSVHHKSATFDKSARSHAAAHAD